MFPSRVCGKTSKHGRTNAVNQPRLQAPPIIIAARQRVVALGMGSVLKLPPCHTDDHEGQSDRLKCPGNYPFIRKQRVEAGRTHQHPEEVLCVTPPRHPNECEQRTAGKHCERRILAVSEATAGRGGHGPLESSNLKFLCSESHWTNWPEQLRCSYAPRRRCNQLPQVSASLPLSAPARQTCFSGLGRFQSWPASDMSGRSNCPVGSADKKPKTRPFRCCAGSKRSMMSDLVSRTWEAASISKDQF